MIKSLDQVAHEVNALRPLPSERGMGDKYSRYHDYLDYYEKKLTSFEGKPFRLLEIGIAGGYSVITWLRRYPTVHVVAIDIDLTQWETNRSSFLLTPDESARLTILQGNACDATFLNAVLGHCVFDIIVDDGSHHHIDMKMSFEILFPTFLNPKGLYIVEDVHCTPNFIGFPFLTYAMNLLPFTYKVFQFPGDMFTGRETIQKRCTLHWRMMIKEIAFSRDVIIFTKEDLVTTTL